MQVIDPQAIHIDTREEIEALHDVCQLAYLYAKDYQIAGFPEQRRQRALKFAQRIWDMHMGFIENEE